MLSIELISLGFLLNISAFQNQVHHGHREHRGGFLMIQSRQRRDDWIINSLPAGRPSGIESQMLQDTLIQDRMCVLKGQKVFIWRVPPRQIKKYSPCPPCLCGEKLILDKSDMNYFAKNYLGRKT